MPKVQKTAPAAKATPKRPTRATATGSRVKKSVTSKVASRKAATQKVTNHKAANHKAGAQKSAAQKASVRKAGAQKAGAQKAGAQKAGAQKAGPQRTSSHKASGARTGGRRRQPTSAFVASQRGLLLAERDTYLRSAAELKAQADSLALEHEPGDVQFDEEGGEGGTSNVDRELDLVLSAQARAAVEEIDRALAKIDGGTYGLCEKCGQPIPEARLEALPHASLCVSCKSGGLSSRR